MEDQIKSVVVNYLTSEFLTNPMAVLQTNPFSRVRVGDHEWRITALLRTEGFNVDYVRLDKQRIQICVASQHNPRVKETFAFSEEYLLNDVRNSVFMRGLKSKIQATASHYKPTDIIG